MTELIKYPPNKKGNEYTIAFQTMRIGSMAFHFCKQLKRIVLPEKLERICSLTFAESGIQSIKIPSSVRKIGDLAFECCDNLEALEIPEGVKNIGNSIVVGCASLKTLELPTSLEIILSNSFNGCENLNSIVAPSKWTSKIEEYLKTSNLPKNRIKQITITCKEKEKEDRNKEFRGKYTTGSNGEGVVKPSTNQLSDSIISPEIR